MRLLDQEGCFLEVNEAACHMLGYAREEMLKLRVPDIESIESTKATRAHIQQILALGGDTFETHHLRKDGTRLPAEVSVSVLPELEQMVVFVRDITLRKRAEEDRFRLQTQLERSQKMESLGSLAGGVAHDMNNVLGAILGLASANLEIQPENSPTYRAFETIAKAATRGGEMVKGLLSFARKSPVEERELDLNALLREEVRLLERTTLSKVRLELELAADLRPILGDASALTHALMNLCVNAVDAMPENGTLVLRTTNRDQWAEVSVEDTGSGMPKEVLERAFDPFFTTKEVGKGTGLGLSMVYSIVKAHRGQVEIESEPGQGTRIRMCFPAHEPAPRPVASGLDASERSSVHSLKVLLVDDDELIQSSLQVILEMLGHTPILAASGEDALVKLAAGYRPEVVILDMNMPGLGGVGTLPRLRDLCPDLPVLLATGRVDQTALRLAETFSRVRILSKPYSVAQLQQAFNAIGPS